MLTVYSAVPSPSRDVSILPPRTALHNCARLVSPRLTYISLCGQLLNRVGSPLVQKPVCAPASRADQPDMCCLGEAKPAPRRSFVEHATAPTG